MNERKFTIFEGGKKEEVEKNKKQIKRQDRIASQDSLTPGEQMELVREIREDGILGIMKKISRFNGEIIHHKDAEFIYDRIAGMALGNEQVIAELYEKFPKLSGYFDMNIKRLKEIQAKGKAQKLQVIEGGKKEPEDNKIKKIIAEQNKEASNLDSLDNLDMHGYVDLAMRIRRMGPQGLKDEMLRNYNVILSKENANEIFKKITIGTAERKKNIRELKEKFPTLSDYFNMLLEKIKDEK